MAYVVKESLTQMYRPLVAWESLRPERGPALWAGEARSAEGVPKRGVLKSGHKKLPDIFYFKGTFVVCERFRGIVERLEPGVQQFFPFEIIGKMGDPVPGTRPYYLLNVTQKFDAVLVSKSNIIWIVHDEKLVPGRKKFPSCGRGPLQLVVSRPRIAGHHIWRSDMILGGELFFSEVLVKEIESARLKKLKFTPVEESDEVWSAEDNLTPP